MKVKRNYYLQSFRSDNEQLIINNPTSNQTEIIQIDDDSTNNTEVESINSCVTQEKNHITFCIILYA